MAVPTVVILSGWGSYELVGPRPAGTGDEVWPAGAKGEGHLVAGRRWWLQPTFPEHRLAYHAAAGCWRREWRRSEAAAWSYEGTSKLHSEACDGAAPPKEGTWVTAYGSKHTLRWGDQLVPEAHPTAVAPPAASDDDAPGGKDAKAGKLLQEKEDETVALQAANSILSTRVSELEEKLAAQEELATKMAATEKQLGDQIAALQGDKKAALDEVATLQRMLDEEREKAKADQMLIEELRQEIQTHIDKELRQLQASPGTGGFPHTSADATEGGPPSSFATSRYLRIYEETKEAVPKRLHTLLTALDIFLQSFCAKQLVPDVNRERFYVQLVQDATDATRCRGDSLTDLEAIALRIWSSKKQLKWQSGGVEVEKEFCAILNAVVREDDPELLGSGITIVHAINQLCVKARTHEVHWPRDHQCYRGGGLPVEHLKFFTMGKRYRVPMFLATTTNADIALGTFALRSIEQNLPPVLFTVRLHPRFHCMHVNYLGDKSLVAEEEFLFAPYSAFRVLEVEPEDEPDLFEGRLTRIVIEAEIDNKRAPEDLPLAPWH